MKQVEKTLSVFKHYVYMFIVSKLKFSSDSGTEPLHSDESMYCSSKVGVSINERLKSNTIQVF